ncbi:MAG: hypothetical protein AAGD32_11140 [Planctomycetota bacterium]
MTEPLEYRSANVKPGPPGAMIAYGVITLILAALSGCITIASPIGLYAAAQQTGSPGVDTVMIGQIIAAMAIYLVAAIVLTAGGIGMVRGQRWVRPYTLAISVPAVGFGLARVIGVVSTWSIPATASTDVGTNPNTPFSQDQAMMVGMIVGGVFTLLFGVGLPLMYALYFRRQDVADALERCDPRGYFGAHLPIPALALAVWLALAALFGLTSIVNPILPAFATYLTGAPAMIGLALGAALLLLAAWLVWQRNFAGWIIAAVVLLLWALSITVTPLFAEDNMFAALSDQQVQQFGAMLDDFPSWPIVIGGIVQIGLIIIGLLWARPHVAGPID